MEKTLKKPRLIKSAGLLATGSVIAKIIGALYRIPLTNVLGAEGMGMYQLVFPVFALFIVLSSAGIPTALSRIIAEKRVEGEDCKKYLRAAIVVLLSLAAFFATLIVALSKPLAILQGNENVSVGYLVIAPSVIFVAAIAGLRGWFQGEMFMLPTAISNIVEQVVKLIVGITLSVYLAKRGVVYAVCGAILGVTISEFFALLYLVATYFFRRKKYKSEYANNALNNRLSKDEKKSMFKVAFPIAVVAVLLPLSNFFDSFIVVNMLKIAGNETAVATAEYGLYSGPVTSLINTPVVVIMSLAIAIVPFVSSSRIERDISGVMAKSRLSLKLAYATGFGVAGFFLLFGKTALSILYPALSIQHVNTTYNLFMICVPNVVFLSAMQIYISLLQALDKTILAVKSVVCAICVKIVLSLLLTRFAGIIGVAISNLAFGAVAYLILNFAFVRLTSIDMKRNVAVCFVSSLIAFATCLIPYKFIANDIVAISVGFVVFYIIYFCLIMIFKAFDDDEYKSLPFGNALLKLSKSIRFWEYGGKND